MYMLVDCDNFFVSCERLFQPGFKKTPVAVLSNNDGCFVARSQEVKDLGIKVGTPLFKVKGLVEKHKVKTFSANFSLYLDISKRVMDALSFYTKDLREYSIDEAFLYFKGDSQLKDFTQLAHEIVESIETDIGIPISIGVAESKTLAKLATEVVKKSQNKKVFNLSLLNRIEKESLFAKFKIGEVWGIGKRSADKLAKYGVMTVSDFIEMDEKRVKTLLSIVGVRIQNDLKGLDATRLRSSGITNKSIMSTRSFGTKVISKGDLKSAIAHHISSASKKLRTQKALTNSVYAYIRTSPYDAKQVYYSRGFEKELPEPTSDSGILTDFAFQILDQIYIKGLKYSKCGVCMADIVPESAAQKSFFSDIKFDDSLNRSQAYAAIDQINEKYGKSKVRSAVELNNKWYMKSENRTPRYTTSWEELPKVY